MDNMRSSDHSIADELMRDMEWKDKRFRDFVDWCYEKFPNQMKVLAETYVETQGKEMYQEYLGEMDSPENRASVSAEMQRDAEMGR